MLEGVRYEALGVIPIGAIGTLINRVHQPRTLLVRGLNDGMGTDAGADELVEIPTDACACSGPRCTPFIYRRRRVLMNVDTSETKKLSTRGKDRGAAERPSDRHLDRRRQDRENLHGKRRAAPSFLPTRPIRMR